MDELHSIDCNAFLAAVQKRAPCEHGKLGCPCRTMCDGCELMYSRLTQNHAVLQDVMGLQAHAET